VKTSDVRNRPLENKTAILCGGSKGIGKETAKRFASLGGSVCVLARHREALASAAEEIRALVRGGEQFVEVLECDATDIESLRPLLTDFIDRHGVPDFLVNLVGYSYPQYVEKLSLADYRDSMEANYFGQLIPTLVLLPYFIAAREGQLFPV